LPINGGADLLLPADNPQPTDENADETFGILGHHNDFIWRCCLHYCIMGDILEVL
jgi:hypothetical protein